MQGAIDEEGPDGRAGIVDLVAPFIFLVPKELGADLRQRVPLGAEVVEDHIQIDRQPRPMRGIDQGGQVLGPAVAVLRRIGQHTVITPAAGSGELAQGEKLDRGNPKLRQPPQLICLGRGGEGAGLGEGPDMHFGNHLLGEGAGLPPRPSRCQSAKVAQDRMALDPAPLLDRGGIGKAQCARPKAVDRPLRRADLRPMHAVGVPDHRDGAAFQLKHHRIKGRRPKSQAPGIGPGRARAPPMRRLDGGRVPGQGDIIANRPSHLVVHHLPPAWSAMPRRPVCGLFALTARPPFRGPRCASDGKAPHIRRPIPRAAPASPHRHPAEPRPPREAAPRLAKSR